MLSVAAAWSVVCSLALAALSTHLPFTEAVPAGSIVAVSSALLSAFILCRAIRRVERSSTARIPKPWTLFA